MRSPIGWRRLGCWAAALIWAVASDAAPASEVAGVSTAREARRLFADPPREYASAPLWVWNDRLTEAQIRGTLRDLAEQKVKQVFVHPRPGLMTPYLGREWFDLWKVALDEAGKRDMNVWIYDENSYPSGFAGGFVPEQMPESRGMGLTLTPAKVAPAWDNALVATFQRVGDGYEDVTSRTRDGASLSEGEYLVARIVRSGNSPWHGNRSYVNLLTEGVTAKFLEVTLGAYDREVAGQYGKRIPGVFTDEPNIRPAGGFPWCPDLPEQFRKRWGYDLVAQLPALAREVGDWRRVRHNYLSTLNDLFIERWGRPYYEACEKRGLEFTGHYWDHEWPECLGVPDNMAMAAWQHRPGIDTLMNQYAEHTHAQFGNVRYPREISSVANQLGRGRTLVELYGAGGWDLRFEDMKRIADWLQVLGINTMDEHLSYVTVRGARKRDHPQSFSYHEPWWPAYGVHAAYMTRLSAALTQGRQVNRVLVLEPTSTAWMYQGHRAKLEALGDRFSRLLMELEGAQIEYDLGCEDIVARQGSIGGDAPVGGGWASTGGLRVGERQYQIVVVPERTENLNRRTWELLRDFAAVGGQVMAVGALPERLDGGSANPFLEDSAARRRWRVVPPAELVPGLRRWMEGADVVVDRAAGDRGILFHHRRELADGELMFLVNTSLEQPSRGAIRAKLSGVERWDPYTGAIEAYPHRVTTTGIFTEFELPPSGSLLLFMPASVKRSAPFERRETVERIAGDGPVTARRVGPNVLVLDHVDVTAGGETRRDQYFYRANAFAWQKNGMERNPWDSAVQFEDELIRKTFPPDSGFEATYRFVVDGPVPSDLAIVVERPDLYAIECNGRPLKAPPGHWWLDHAFGRIPIAGVARSGENTVTLRAAPFTILHELEAAYVLGSFSLRATERGWTIVPEQSLRLAAAEGEPVHGHQPDGTMWLSGGIGYEAGIEDRTPKVRFDLGAAVELSALRIWNYNESHVSDLTRRGTARLAVKVAAEASGPETALGEWDLAKAGGGAAKAQEVRVRTGGPVRFVTLEPRANHAGVTFPALGNPPDNGFVGLAEVQFVDATGQVVRGVRVAGSPVGLGSHRRIAEHLVDGSGLAAPGGLGWNDQGLPFYSEGVAYRQTFKVADRKGSYRLALPRWNGSVARVSVNGRDAGWITAPPYECDVTRHLRRGENEVEVTVIGTLRNTLGPHHSGAAAGSAWPGMFQKGPASGLPPGGAYSTFAYGLFEPPVLRRIQSR